MKKKPKKKRSRRPRTLTGLQVLVVDDDPASLKLVDVVLTQEGCDVRLATSAEEALECLSAGFVPALVVLDLVLPAMQGLVLAAQIKARHPKTVIVAVSAVHGSALERAIRAAGCATLVRKPIDLATFPSILLTCAKGL